MHTRILPILFALLLTTACDGAFSASSADDAPTSAGDLSPSAASETPDENGEEISVGLGEAAVSDAPLDEPPPKDADGSGCRGKGKWACPITEPAPTEPTEPPATCGNGVIDEGETCDGSCPTSCSAPDSCTAATLSGDVKMCNAVCTYEEVTACVDGDGCCPSGCAFNNDSDCEKDTGGSGGGGGGGQIDCTDDATWPQAWKDYEAQVIAAINQERARGAVCGNHTMAPAEPLTLHPLLQIAGRCHVLDMDRYGYFSHTSLDGRYFDDRIYDLGYLGWATGETLAYGYTTPSWVVQGWMDSPMHCAALMEPRASQVGVGYSNISRTLWAVELGTGG